MGYEIILPDFESLYNSGNHMKIIMRLAQQSDFAAVCRLYDHIHAAEESGQIHTGWIRNVYPTPETAAGAIQRDELFVQEVDEQITGAAIINQLQHEVYRSIDWDNPAADDMVMVLHTFMIDPTASAQGLGKKFVKFYESLAIARNAPFLRMDTNAINAEARQFYRKLGYREKGIRKCCFNKLENVNLVMLEKFATNSEND